MKITRVIEVKEGKKFRISPSRAFLGVEDGLIEIKAVLEPEEAQVNETVRDFIEAAVDEDIIESNPEEAEFYSILMSSTWVVYEYLTGLCKGDEFAFPVDEFVCHVSTE